MVNHVRWDDLEWERLNPLLDRKFISAGNVTLARFVLRKGAVVPTHRHANEQVSYIVEGALKFLLDGKEVVVRTGEVLCIPPQVPHSAEALEETKVVDIFTPRRADWESKQDAYLRGPA